METVNVYSPVEDKQIRTNLNNSPIWKKAYHEDELERAEKRYPHLFKYTFKFDGLKPIQVTKIRRHAR